MLLIDFAFNWFIMNKKFLILLIVILTLILTLFFINPKDQNTSVIIVDADKVVQNKSDFYNKELRIRGFVKPGSILRMGNIAEFIIIHNNQELPVYFNGKTQIPDTFGDAVPIRVDGKLNDNGYFVAHKIEAKCASKYDAADGKNHQMLKYEDFNKKL